MNVEAEYDGGVETIEDGEHEDEHVPAFLLLILIRKVPVLNLIIQMPIGFLHGNLLRLPLKTSLIEQSTNLGIFVLFFFGLLLCL